MKRILWMLMAVFMTTIAGCSSDNDGPKEDPQDETPGTPNVPMSLGTPAKTCVRKIQ